MRCSVVFGVTLRLLVINISLSSPAINTAAYYQRCVITCETVAVVHRRPCLQHLACCSVNTGSQARYAQNRDFCLPHLHSTPPLWGLPSEYRYPVWYWKTRIVWLPDGEKISKIRLFVLTWSTNVTDTQTDGQTDTAWRHKPRLCIASCSKNVIDAVCNKQ